MANEIRYRDPSGTTGLNLYAFRFTPTGTVWNGSSHVAFNASSWATYAITLSAFSGGGFYAADMPAAGAGKYEITVFRRAGGAPAATDQSLGAGEIEWDGSAEVPLSSRLAPTVSGRTLDVTATGAAGVDWANVENPGTSVGLSNTTISSVAASTTIRAGTAQGGSTTTITLDSGAGSTDNLYRYCTIVFTGGTGAGQSAVINAYVGSTKIATFTAPVATAPDNTTTFTILPLGAVVMGAIGGSTRTITQDYNGTDSLTVTSSVTGDPILGATVTAYLAAAYASDPGNATSYGTATTDASGHWSLTLAPAVYTLVFSSSQDVSQAVTITVN